MQAVNFNRRNLLKKGSLALGLFALTPYDIWSRAVEQAHIDDNRYLFSNSAFNEFRPPLLKESNAILARLRANENPYGPSPKALEAFRDAAINGNRYSWDKLEDLVEKLTVNEGVTPEQILMGPGSSDLLEKTAMVFFQKGGNVVSADPSYMSLINVSKAVGASWKSIKLLDNSQHDLDAMEAAIDDRTHLVYICNPNNPTGSITDAKKLKDFCSRVSERVPVFIDEAYIELSENGIKDSMVSLVAEGKNVMIARTFSKIHGMAGLRIGYVVGSVKLLDRISEVTRGGMGITGPSVAAAAASLEEHSFLEDCKAKITAARNYTFRYLEKRGLPYLPSQTNFVIFEIPMEGDLFLEQIFAKQVSVRAFKFWDKNWCRVSMGTLEEMKLFTAAIDEIIV